MRREENIMLELTFAEQVKLVLGRKNMTIKQLAEEIEEKTGMKMSRQNLTQRLGRDNFQEKDMRLIAEILECPFKLSILDAEEDQIVVKEVIVKEEPTFEPVKEIIKKPVKEITEKPEETTVKKPGIEIVETKKPENEREVTVGEITTDKIGTLKEETPFKPGKLELNPYTGYEYKTNTVRVHPTRIGYVQVYDRKDHKWTEMTEWAFLGYQERQKLTLGKAYQDPTYID